MDYSGELKKYVCGIPFTKLEIFEDDVFCCCPSYIDTPIGKTNDLPNILNSKILSDIQTSIIDGDYSYCNKKVCPFLIGLIHNNNASDVFYKKTKANIKKLRNKEGGLIVKINIDPTCNLSCPSCRISIIKSDTDKVKSIKLKIHEIGEVFGKYTTEIQVTGNGDPFASKALQDFLINFDETLYPKLEKIRICTNANLLNKTMWDKLYKVHKYIKLIEISIDASTEETYKIVRRNGNWKRLFDNVKFLITIPTIDSIYYSFVVQDTNYKEMKPFIKLISGLYDSTNSDKYTISFNRVLNWGSFTEEEYKVKKVWDEEHPEFTLFLAELNKIVNNYNTYYDMRDIITKYSLTGNLTLL